MDLVQSLHNFTAQVGLVVAIAIPTAIIAVLVIIFVQDYLHKRAQQRQRVWKDL